MKLRRYRAARLAAALLAAPAALAPVFATPAQAIIVYDPTNYAQNVLQAARALQQINNQITSLQNEAQSLINQARNLTSLPFSSLQQLQQSVQRTQQLLSQAQGIAYNVQNIDRAFQTNYGGGSASMSASDQQLVAQAKERWNNTVSGLQDAMRVQAGVVGNIDTNRTQMSALVGQSQGATGALQATQAGKASGTGFTVADMMRPGRVAQTGLDAGRPLLDSISDLMGYWSFFENFIQIAVMLLAWALVLLAFFILAIQLFVTLIEFKLTTLAGFVLIPFGLFGKSAFMAERVLGNVISSGIKVLVLGVIIGIGSSLFSEFTAGFGGRTPTIDEAMAIVLAALTLLGLGIFGPGIANGLVSGGPQLGAGAAVGTGLAAGGMVAAGAATVGAVASGGAALAGGAAAAARGGAALAGGASTAYSLGAAGQTGASGVASGLGGVARAAGSAATSPLRRAAERASSSMRSSFADGARPAFEATGGSSTMGTVGEAANDAAPTPSGGGDQPPAWARRMKRSQQMSHAVSTTVHAVRSGDSHGGGSSINLSEGDR